MIAPRKVDASNLFICSILVMNSLEALCDDILETETSYVVARISQIYMQVIVIPFNYFNRFILFLVRAFVINPYNNFPNFL